MQGITGLLSKARRDSESSSGPQQSDHEAEALNILLLGETGVGKSTFINAIFNYLTYDTVEAARKGGVRVAVPARFTVKSKKTGKSEGVQVGDENISGEENFGDKGESSTQHPKSHLFGFEMDGIRRYIRIIDTPGVGDTRGVEADKENFENIFSILSSYDHINGLCILLKPDEPRLTPSFEYCISEMLVHFHKTVSKNITFCFTRTKGTDYEARDTLIPLRELLRRIREKCHVEIPLDESTMFCFENETFRYLAADSKNAYVPSNAPTESWAQSRSEVLRLMKFVAGQTPHSIQETLSIHRVQKVLENMEEPLGLLASTAAQNLKSLEDTKRKIQASETSINDLEKLLTFRRKVVNYKDIDVTRTVCSDPSCVDIVDTGDEKKIVYKTICHDQCSWEEVEDPASQRKGLDLFRWFKQWSCSAMDIRGICKNCGHHANVHVFIDHEIEESYVEEYNPEIQKRIHDGQSARDVANALLEACDEKTKQLGMEKATIEDMSIRFATFLSVNSVTPGDDHVGKYLQQEIKTKEKTAKDPHEKAEIQRLEKTLLRQREKVRKNAELVNKGLDSEDVSLKQLNPSNVMADIGRLYDLPLTGPAFRQAHGVLKKAKANTAATRTREVQHWIPSLKGALGIAVDVARFLA